MSDQQVDEIWGDPGQVLLDRLSAGLQQQISGEIAQLGAIEALCTRYRATDPESYGPLVERSVPSGGDGTPSVSEWLCLEIGAALGISPQSAATRIAQAMDLAHRHPAMHSAVKTGRVRAWQAAKITGATAAAGLSLAAAQWVDARISPHVARLPFGRVLRLLEGLIAQADPALAEERAAAARETRHVEIWSEATTGVGHVFATLDLGDAALLDGMLRLLAGKLRDNGDTDSLHLRRAKALGLLATPARALAILQDCPEYLEHHLDIAAMPVKVSDRLLPKTTLMVHCSLDAVLDGEGVARAEGIGPVVLSQLGDLLKDSRVTVRPVIDHNSAPAVDSYEIPRAVRAAVLNRTPTDAFPYGTRAAANCDLDHTIAFRHRSPVDHDPPSGLTSVDNLTPLNKRAHRAKTLGDHRAGKWRYSLTPDGYHLWTSPLERHYVTGPQGTTRHDSLIEATIHTRIERLLAS